MECCDDVVSSLRQSNRCIRKRDKTLTQAADGEGNHPVEEQGSREEVHLAYLGSQEGGNQEEDQLAYLEEAQACRACQEEVVSRRASDAPS